MSRRFDSQLAIAFLPVLSLLVAACAAQPLPPSAPREQFASAVSPPPRLEPREPLPGVARAVLRSRMADHTRDMSSLVSAILVLDYPTIHSRAEAVASDANLSRPLGGDATELNTFLPEKFFQYQDELRTNARGLAAAADHLDAAAVAEAYGRVSESCVRCHASYRAGR